MKNENAIAVTCNIPEIMKLDINSNIISAVPFPPTIAVRWAEDCGRSKDAFVIVDLSSVDENEQSMANKMKRLRKNGFCRNGIRYVQLIVNSSHTRKNKMIFIDRTLKDDFMHHVFYGFL